MPIFPSLDSSPSQQGLAQMLINLQRQGAEQTARVGPMLGEGLAQMLQGFQREGDIGRQREFAATQDRLGREHDINRANIRAKEEVAQIAEADRLARERARMAAGVRGAQERRSDQAAMARAKLAERGATERAEIASGGRRSGAERWTELAGKGIAAVGGGLMDMAEHQRKVQADIARTAVARERIAAEKETANARLAASAARQAVTMGRQDSARSIVQQNMIVSHLRKSFESAKRELDKRSFGGLVEPPKGLADKVNAMEFDLQQAEGKFMDLVGQFGASATPAPTPATAGGMTDEDILNAIAEGG